MSAKSLPSISTGIDILYLPEFEKSLRDGGQEFKDRLFTATEQAIFTTIESMAGAFCAKESFLKASANSSLTPLQVTLDKDPSGKPVIITDNPAGVSIDISISHQGDYAIANCVILKS